MNDQEKIYLLATKIMGWKRIDGYGWQQGDSDFNPVIGEWNPLQNIEHAWQVVEKLKGNFDSFCLGHTPDGWFCQFQNILPPELEDDLIRTEEFDGEGKTAQEAICSAAIKLLEVKCE